MHSFESEQGCDHAALLLNSYEELIGKALIERSGDRLNDARRLYRAPFIVLSHDGSEDPCFTYANEAAQNLWGYSWEEFIGLPSRFSAEADERHARREMLNTAQSQGWFGGYRGIRISKDGRRFAIEQAMIWNLLDKGIKVGQAVSFADWSYI